LTLRLRCGIGRNPGQAGFLWRASACSKGRQPKHLDEHGEQQLSGYWLALPVRLQSVVKVKQLDQHHSLQRQAGIDAP